MIHGCRFTPRASGGLGHPPDPGAGYRMMRSYDDADIVRRSDNSVLVHSEAGAPRQQGETLPRLKGGGGIKTKPVAKIIASSRSVSRQEMGGETGEAGDWDEVNIVTHPFLVLIRFYIAEDR